MARLLLVRICQPDEQLLRKRPRHELEADSETIVRESGGDSDRRKPDDGTQTPVVAQPGQVDILSRQRIRRNPQRRIVERGIRDCVEALVRHPPEHFLPEDVFRQEQLKISLFAGGVAE